MVLTTYKTSRGIQRAKNQLTFLLSPILHPSFKLFTGVQFTQGQPPLTVLSVITTTTITSTTAIKPIFIYFLIPNRHFASNQILHKDN